MDRQNPVYRFAIHIRPFRLLQHAFELEQTDFGFNASRITGETAVSADDPMAGHDKRDRIVVQSPPMARADTLRPSARFNSNRRASPPYETVSPYGTFRSNAHAFLAERRAFQPQRHFGPRYATCKVFLQPSFRGANRRRITQNRGIIVRIAWLPIEPQAEQCRFVGDQRDAAKRRIVMRLLFSPPLSTFPQNTYLAYEWRISSFDTCYLAYRWRTAK